MLVYVLVLKSSLTVSELQQVEDLVLNIIHQNADVYVEEVPLSSAKQIAGLRTVDEVFWNGLIISPRNHLISVTIL